MSKLEQQFFEDRQLRDSAKAVLLADIEHARTSLAPKTVAKRVTGRVGDGALDVFDVAKGHADDNRGIIAILLGALFVWLAREPILEILGLEEPKDNGSDGENEVSETPQDQPPPEPPPAPEIRPGDDNEQ